MTRFMIAAVLTLTFASIAPAQVKLKWKLKDNEKLTVTTKTSLQQTLSIAGQDLETKNDQTLIAEVANGQRATDGTIERKTTIKSMKAEMSLPGGVTLNFDSAKEVEPQGTQFDRLLDLMAAVSKTTSKSVCGKDNRVISIKPDLSAHEKLDDEVKALLKGRYDEDYLKKTANLELDRIPAKAVKKGSSWKLSQTSRLEGGQSMTFKTTYTYEGTTKKDGKSVDKISFVSTDVTYAQEGEGAGAKVVDSKMKVVSSDGELLFDRTLGRIISQKEKIRIKGEMTIEVGDNKLPAKLDLQIATSSIIK